MNQYIEKSNHWYIPVVQYGLSEFRLNRLQLLFCPVGGGSQPEPGEQLHIQAAVTAAEQVPASHQGQIPVHTTIISQFLVTMTEQ